MKYNELHWDDKTSLEAVIQALKMGDAVIGTTDTVLGLLADTTQEGFDCLNQIKGRSNKPYLILIPSQEALYHFVDLPLAGPVQKLVDQCWPGPLTIIFKVKAGAPSHLTSPDGTIALRVPKHAGLQAVLKHFNGLFSTSANMAGGPIPETIEQLDPLIRQKVAHLVVDSDTGQPASLPSTIIDCSGDEIKIVREGAFSKEHLMQLIR